MERLATVENACYVVLVTNSREEFLLKKKTRSHNSGVESSNFESSTLKNPSVKYQITNES